MEGRSPQTGRNLTYAGYDVGRKKDLAVYFELEKRGDVLWQVEYEVLDKVGFPVQIQFLKDKMRNPKLARLCIDYTSMGGPVCEEVQRCFGQYRVEGVTFSNPVKEALAMPLRAAFEDRTIRIADDPAIRDDLYKIRKTMTAAGNIRYEAERDENGHSDRFWALALALHAKGGNDGPCRMALPEKEEESALNRVRLPLRPDHRSDRKISLNERTDW